LIITFATMSEIRIMEMSVFTQLVWRTYWCNLFLMNTNVGSLTFIIFIVV